MANGYKIRWTENALSELAEIIYYLKTHWTERELNRFSSDLDHTIQLISKNPKLFQASIEKPDIRKAVILKLNTLYYRVNSGSVEILSLYLNRKNPEKRKL